MRAGGVSLFERFGLIRLHRPTDVRDAALPEPARDEFGVGFMQTRGPVYLEFRRAYLAWSVAGSAPLTLLVRNNSRYFGHDRLPAPVLIATHPLTPAQVQGLTPAEVHDAGLFRSWSPAAAPPALQYAVEEGARDLALAADRFDRWLADPQDGIPALAAFLDALVSEGRPLPFLTRQPALHAVTACLAVTDPVRAALRHWGTTGHLDPVLAPVFGPWALERLVLTSGPTGDGPVPPAIDASSR
jgi:hypothetical protein